MKRLIKFLIITGLIMLPLSVIMFIIGVGMFTASGDFPQFVIRLSEVCFAFWLPFLILGLIFTTIGAIMGLIFERKKS